MSNDVIADDLDVEPLRRLSKDLKTAARTLSSAEARYLVDAYYQLQEDRIRSDGQIRATRDSDEPHATLAWLADNTGRLERQIRSALDAYGDAHLVGRWSKSVVGIGPVISAGLLAHLDLEPWRCAVARERPKEKACKPDTPHGADCHPIAIVTVGQIWRFAGLDPTVRWEKKTKRPWNASLKTLCWKIGESFVKVSGRDDDVYGHLYLKRKAYEQAHNEAGDYAAQAAAKLERFKIGKSTDAFKAYDAGRLPPGHIHARAKRFTVKLFLAHWHQVAYRERFGEMPPKPYVIDQLRHAHEITCPNWPF